MGSWISRLATWATARRGRPQKGGLGTPHRQRGIRPGIEGLERREVLTAAVTPFVSVIGKVPAVGQTATVDFLLASGSLTRPTSQETVLIGLSPRPAAGSAITPTVLNIVGPDGKAKAATYGTGGAPFLSRVAIPAGGGTTYKATVAARSDAAGDFVLDGFLPGDVNGDLRVDSDDMDVIREAYATRQGDPRYNAAADINQDGVVGCRDRAYATQNLGATATVITRPVVVAPVPVATPVAAPVVMAAPAVTPTVVAPVVQAAAPVPVTAAVAAPAPTIVWVPVVMEPGGATAPPGTFGGLTWSPHYSAYYPSQAGGSVPSGPMTYFNVPTTGSPSGPLYYAAPAGQPYQQPIYIASPAR